MLRDGASRLLSMRVRYLILLIGEERAQASVSKDCWCQMLRGGASRLLGMRVRYFILPIGEERAQASVSKDSCARCFEAALRASSA